MLYYYANYAYAMLCFAMLLAAMMLCYAMLCFAAMLCYAILCNASMLCHCYAHLHDISNIHVKQYIQLNFVVKTQELPMSTSN